MVVALELLAEVVDTVLAVVVHVEEARHLVVLMSILVVVVLVVLFVVVVVAPEAAALVGVLPQLQLIITT